MLEEDSAKLSKAGSEIVQINKRPDGHFIVCLDQSAKKSAPRINGQHLGSRAVKRHNPDVIDVNHLKTEYYLAG